MTRRPAFLFTLLASMLLCSVTALIELWSHPLSLRGIGASLGAGAAFGAVLATSVTFIRTPSRFALFSVCALAGGIGGLAWWALLRPSSSLVAALAIGVLVGLAWVVFDELFGQAAA